MREDEDEDRFEILRTRKSGVDSETGGGAPGGGCGVQRGMMGKGPGGSRGAEALRARGGSILPPAQLISDLLHAWTPGAAEAPGGLSGLSILSRGRLDRVWGV